MSLDIDENESGQKATNKSIYILNEFGFCENISVIKGMPVGEDPAKFLLHNDMKDFLALEKILTAKEISKMCKQAREENR